MVNFLKSLSQLFYPMVEWTVFNSSHDVVETFNPFSSRKEDMQWDEKATIDRIEQELLSTGKKVKTLHYSFRDQSTKVNFLRVRYDLSHFQALQEQLGVFLQKGALETAAPITQTWEKSIDQTINLYLSTQNLTIENTSQKDKREIISLIQKQGLLAFKEASSYVAMKMQTSRATVYNYLKQTDTLSKIHVHQVDAFTDQRFAGNPAGVVLDAEVLDEAMMRKIARELNVSETSFVMPSEIADFRLRYFTPTGHEIIFCGHSTVGALYMIAREKRFGIKGEGSYDFNVQTQCGILNMSVLLSDNETIHLEYEVPKIDLKTIKITFEEVVEACDINITHLDTKIPLLFEKTSKNLFIAVKSLKDLEAIRCNSKSLASFSKKYDLVALCFVTPHAFSKKNDMHMRCFAPYVGVDEDPFTGSVLGGLAAFVTRSGWVQAQRFRVEQGHFLNRPGTVEVELLHKGNNLSARVYAQAVHCFSTEITLK